jgi:hypothetical protein
MGGWHSEITDCWFVFCELGLDALKWVECSSIAAMFWFQIIQIVVLLHSLTEGGNQQSRGDSTHQRRRLITPENHVFDDFLLAWEEMLLGPLRAVVRLVHAGLAAGAILVNRIRLLAAKLRGSVLVYRLRGFHKRRSREVENPLGAGN